MSSVFNTAAMIAFLPCAWGFQIRHGMLFAWLVADDLIVTRGGRWGGITQSRKFGMRIGRMFNMQVTTDEIVCGMLNVPSHGCINHFDFHG